MKYLLKVSTKSFLIRDLKLGNVFLNDSMEVKIGDFGLATKVESIN